MTAPDDDDPNGGLRKALGAPSEPSAASGATAVPPPLPVKRLPAGSAAPRPAGIPRPDPFQEPSQARLPVGAHPEAKLEYFRQVVRLKDETLERGRNLYSDRVAELEQVRAAAAALSAELSQNKAHATSLGERTEELSRQLAARVNERLQLTAALAEANAKLEGGQRYIEAQNAAFQAQQQALAAAARSAAELEQELGNARRQLAEATASHERSKADQTELALALETAAWRGSSAVASPEVARERERSARALELVETRLAEKLEEERAARAQAEKALQDAQATLERERQAARAGSVSGGGSPSAAMDLHAALAQELEEERAARSQSERAWREAQRIAEEERVGRGAALAALADERKRSPGPLADLHAALGEELDEEKAAREASEKARRQAEGALEEERAARSAVEAALAEEKGTNAALTEEVNLLNAELSEALVAASPDPRGTDLEARIASLERDLERATDERQEAVRRAAESTRTARAPDGAVSSVEREGLKAEINILKKKLVTAEAALEAAASLRQKVMRLEAALRAKK